MLIGKIEQEISKLTARLSDIISSSKKPLIVFKGVDRMLLEEYQAQYFCKGMGTFPIDKADFNECSRRILGKATNILELTEPFYSMFFEEFLLVKDTLDLFFDLHIITNNLYNGFYPVHNHLSEPKSSYQEIFLEDDQSINNNTSSENILNIYGGMTYSAATDSYYVRPHEYESNRARYHDLFDFENCDRGQVFSLETSDVSQSFELFDDETAFLDLIHYVLHRQGKQTIEVALADERLSPNFTYRLGLIKWLSGEEISFVQRQEEQKNEPITNSKEYLRYLEKYWGYTSFKNLEMYKDIRQGDKTIDLISQEKIIDAIVSQACNALDEADFRDVYITSSTGSGKSIMFQIPALYLSNEYPDKKPLTLIISPLIGLMNDQVDSLSARGIKSAKSVHSNLTPQKREEIIQSVVNGEVDMLYLSPETLQNRSDIKTLIGERRVGLVIIDEAHIVTTWGKSFRADYWYLGIYLAKLRKKYKFPVVTFTATSIYGGRENMYLDTLDSLKMIRPITFIGKVKRDDILMDIQRVNMESAAVRKLGNDKAYIKRFLAAMRIKEADKKKHKVLVYFPTVRLLRAFHSFLKESYSELAEKTGVYYGSLEKTQKDEMLLGFKSGEIRFMLATKAFGMGIDISDINVVYHYAMTGNVVDYLQEIGRVARDHQKVEIGRAKLDYMPSDFNEIRKLHGMSAVKKWELIEVMRKIVSLYKTKKNARNLVVSADDFRNALKTTEDDSGIDNRIKTILLMIEKDFSSTRKLNYSPFVARPRTLFGDDMVLVTKDTEELINSHLYKAYFDLVHYIKSPTYAAVYRFNLVKLWEDKFDNLSFPQFKYELYTKNLPLKRWNDLVSKLVFATSVSLYIDHKQGVSRAEARLKEWLNLFELFFIQGVRDNKGFTVKEMGDFFSKRVTHLDRYVSQAYAQGFINSMLDYQSNRNDRIIRVISSEGGASTSYDKYMLLGHPDNYMEFVARTFTELVNAKSMVVEREEAKTVYFARSRDRFDRFSAATNVLGLAQALEILTYEARNGKNPQIYLRINSIYHMEKAINNPTAYHNDFQEEIYQRHELSVKMFKYLFERDMEGKDRNEQITNYTHFFWDTIEDYFMGIIPQEVLK